jgi:hypothetical protein
VGTVVMNERLGWADCEYDRGDGDESEDDPASANESSSRLFGHDDSSCDEALKH